MIAASGITKRFGTTRVLRDVTCTVPAGSVTAVIGPNGAGKTTFNKCVLGLVRPDAGTLTVAGRPVGPEASYRSALGYMPQLPRFPENLTGGDVLALMRTLRGADAARDEMPLDELEVAPLLARPVRTMSGGQRQRLNAALAFLFVPEVLILDEPTAGLDPLSAATLKRHVRRVRDRGAAVLITSHILSELMEVADRVVVMLEGEVRHEGALATLAAEPGGAEAAMLRLLAGTAPAIGATP
ncbi:MAG: ABC transporter ATP-binding protein [Gemmatimonadaceae bacterium]|jgi:Cu-processing system ATP-binding protein|nr:ABC transporter ATP-binding protein [Gemmatimonadaceae bacterium]